MPVVYLGLGSNIRNREENCLRAIEFLRQKGLIITKKSRLYETGPWGVKEQPDYINMALEVNTDLEPEELLRLIKEIEREMGRKETYKWGPRLIDIDILLYDDLTYDRHDLKIPHPLMHERDFVLIPLSEIAPQKVHPVLKKTISELRQSLQRS